MSENVELVRRMYAAGPEILSFVLGGGDLRVHPWVSLWHPDCVLEEPAEIPDGSSYDGREGVVHFFERMMRDVWDEWRFVAREIIEGPSGVFVAVDNSGRSKAGAEVEMHVFQVLRFREGMISFSTAYFDRDTALKAVGLAP